MQQLASAMLHCLRTYNGDRSSVGRVPDCDSGCRGFEPHRSPQIPFGFHSILRFALSCNMKIRTKSRTLELSPADAGFFVHGSLTPQKHCCDQYAELSSLFSRLVARAHCLELGRRWEEHTSDLQSQMRNSYAAFCLNKKQRLTYQF